MSTAGSATPLRQATEVRRTALERWREDCLDQLDRGGRFCGAYAAGDGEERRWNALFAHGSATCLLSAAAPAGRPAPSVVDLLPAADWDEREAHDLGGVEFEGRDSLRPLVDHTEETASWTVPVIGEGTFQVAVGPVHAGVIESGHFRFHVVGERILHLDPRLFYKHRGLERAAAGADLAAGLAFAQRACGACAVTNSVAYALAAEATLGLAPDRETRRARTLLLELERLYNHLNDLAQICSGVGFAPGNMAFAALKERALRLNQGLVGHRFLFGSVVVGEGGPEVSAARADALRGELRELGADAARAWRELAFAASVQARFEEVGVLGAAAAAALGAVGPAARGAGIAADCRGQSPGLWYGSNFAAAVPARASGDIGARVEVRALELEVTFELLADLLAEPIEAGGSRRCEASPVAIARVESPRGETVCALEPRAGRIGRLHLRTGSYANWPAVAAATADNLLPDFPLINKSFELCYACADR
ncbi:MAG TPA: NADH-quinone oxidoreductase subunit C [Solirubrobacterales bacterium]|nr:NADH-quinone oxidoreductase subunit C [Solirubrobacterales bacterium]